MTRKSITIEELQDDLVISSYRGRIQVTKNEAKTLVRLLKPYLKTNKYKNEKSEVNGIKFDSKAEAEFYEFLLLSYAPHQIIIQPKYELQPKLYYGVNDPRNQLAINYIADFAIKDTTLVFDVKGYAGDKTWRIKHKMFKSKYPSMHLSIISKCPKYLQETYDAWIHLDDLKKERKARK